VYDAVYDVLDALQEFAEKTGAAVLLIGHERKGGGGTDAVMGSTAFVDFSRVVTQLLTDPKNWNRKRIWPTKVNNMGLSPGLAFRIQGDRVKWEYKPLPESYADARKAIQALEKASARAPGKIDLAVELLHALVGDTSMPVDEIMAAAAENDISPSTMKTAAKRLKLECPKGGPKRWGPIPPKKF